MRTTRATAATLLTVAIVAGCKHNPPPSAAATPAPAPYNADSARRAQAYADSVANAERLAKAREDSIRAARERALADARSTVVAKIFFDYDQSELSADARGSLDQKLAVLKQYPDVHIRVEGNADERGADEYNLALGQRRAAAAKRYLVDHGVDESRIETISYGEERPACTGHDESCWSQNRRDEFVPTTGALSEVAER